MFATCHVTSACHIGSVFNNFIVEVEIQMLLINLLTASTSMLVMQNCELTCNLPTKNDYGQSFSRFDSMFVVYTLYLNKTVHVLGQMCQQYYQTVLTTAKTFKLYMIL